MSAMEVTLMPLGRLGAWKLKPDLFVPNSHLCTRRPGGRCRFRIYRTHRADTIPPNAELQKMCCRALKFKKHLVRKLQWFQIFLSDEACPEGNKPPPEYAQRHTPIFLVTCVHSPLTLVLFA